MVRRNGQPRDQSKAEGSANRAIFADDVDGVELLRRPGCKLDALRLGGWAEGHTHDEHQGSGEGHAL
jgi:hypothetical protein